MSSDIAPSYVSQAPYMNMNCKQLEAEAETVSSRAIEAAGVQNKKAGNDAALVGVGMVLFWPSLFFVGKDGASSATVARLKGEMQAIENASNKKSCGIKFETVT